MTFRLQHLKGRSKLLIHTKTLFGLHVHMGPRGREDPSYVNMGVVFLSVLCCWPHLLLSLYRWCICSLYYGCHQNQLCPIFLVLWTDAKTIDWEISTSDFGSAIAIMNRFYHNYCRKEMSKIKPNTCKLVTYCLEIQRPYTS